MNANVLILGGGPAGSALGCYLARAGVACTIIDAANHPRPHVGESLVTATTRIFQDIGFLETMEREGFRHKHGATWRPAHGGAPLRVDFAEVPQPGIDQSHTYQVDRARFDHLLLKHAEAAGAKVIQGVRAREVIFDGDRAVGVRVDLGGRTVDLPAAAVADATGRATLLGAQLKIKRPDPTFNQFALHAWFNGVDAGDRPTDIHIHFLKAKRGWAWQIPISDTVSSVGVVAERAAFAGGKGDREGWFAQQVASVPGLAHAMRDAVRVNDFKAEGDYSYAMDAFAGDGWLLLGDAARFVDPIFSSGVSIAMHSAKFAAEALIPALAAGDLSAARLKPYEDRLRAGADVWYEFVSLYYRLLPVFTRFIARPESRSQVVRLLQGDVFNRDSVPVLDAMRAFVAEVEATEGHLLARGLDPEVPLA